MEQLRSGHQPSVHQPPMTGNHNNQQRNDHLTVKWLSTAMSELKTELGEMQAMLNTTVLLQNREENDAEMSLLQTDVINLTKELELQRNQNTRYEAEMSELREELASLKDGTRATAVMCGKTKNQVCNM